MSPLTTPVHNPRMVIHAPHIIPDITYKFEAHFVPIYSGTVSDAAFDQLVQSLLPNSGYYLCPGCHKTSSPALISTPNMQKTFNRVDHEQCQLWFRPAKVPHNLKYPPTCEKCAKLRNYLRKEVSRRATVTPERKAKRVSSSSRCPVKYLTPRSKMKRMKLIQQERFRIQHKFCQHKKYDINVGKATHDELLAVVSHIQHKSKKELEALLCEADSAGKGNILRQKWKQDVEERVAFNKDQLNSGKSSTCLYLAWLTNLLFIPLCHSHRQDRKQVEHDYHQNG